MPTRITLALVSLILSLTGSIQGSVVQAFCTDTGERGFAWSPQLACLAIDCHAAGASAESCADEDCCSFDGVPAQPLAQHSAPSSHVEIGTVAHLLLPAHFPAARNDEPLRILLHGGSPPGPASAAFPGYPLPLLI